MQDTSIITPNTERRQEALDAAKRCETLLTQEFGAKRVILFGSYLGDAFQHDTSDLDLAVEGLDPGRFFAAYSAC